MFVIILDTEQLQTHTAGTRESKSMSANNHELLTQIMRPPPGWGWA